ncbi:MAG: hypothetical protein KBS63_00120 [Clostridiales bacterium]|nr:hypothetical protein [Candidatus Crickella caballi]
MKKKSLLSIMLSLTMCISMMPMAVIESFAISDEDLLQDNTASASNETLVENDAGQPCDNDASDSDEAMGDSDTEQVQKNAEAVSDATLADDNAMLLQDNAAAVSYIYYTVDGNTAIKHTDGSCENYTTVTGSTMSFSDGQWYVVSESVYIGSRITVNGEANLILCDGVKLDTEYGITVNAGNTLNIYAQSEGTEKAGRFSSGKGIFNGACIGGNRGESCGSINIHGGVIEAVSDRSGSGIGTGDGGIGGSINIFDGNITAESDGGYRAGIGGGTGGRVDSITIYGGNVNAKQLSTAAAAIGGGNGRDSGDITINGGTVTAYSCGAGIGGGENGNGGNITINGGTVNATGQNSSAGIGGGRYGNGGNITINGGSVTASGYHGVGAGQNGTDGTLTLGENVTFKAGADKNNIWVSGDNDNVSEAFGKKYFESTDVLVPVEYVYYTADGNTAVKHEDGSCPDYKKVKSTTTAFEDGKWYIVKGDVELGDRLTVAGTANLILMDGATLTASKGIAVSDGNTLNIYGQSEGTGSLVAQTGGESGVAAIGGNYYNDGGTTSIHGGTITAKGTDQGAGIGGGGQSGGGSLTIFDGEVNAVGGEYSAAIGGGRSGAGGNISIYGGTVNATTDGHACGIGGGYTGYSGNITINGGTVNAAGGDVGIGGTHDRNGSVTINGGTVTAEGVFGAINYCDFTLGEAENFEAGASKNDITITGDIDNASDAVGPKYVRTTDVLSPVSYVYYTVDGDKAVKHEDGNCEDYIKVRNALTSFEDGKWYVVSKNVTIDELVGVNGTANIILCDGAKLTCARGTNVSEGSTLNIFAQKQGTGTFESTSKTYAVAGIGGDADQNCGSINIHGGVISAANRDRGAAIGGGGNGNGGSITIFDGDVTAKGNSYAAAIGGGYSGDGGNFTVYGGKVTAITSSSTAAIGGGENGSAGTITINGGSVTAEGDVGIGVSKSGTGGSITINGGDVTATGGWNGAGIGSGVEAAGADIVINGGTVTAKGFKYGAGLGIGKDAKSGGSIIINGGTVIATGGENSWSVDAGTDGSFILGDGVTFDAGSDRDTITVTGDKNNASDALGNKYFTSPHTHAFDQEVVSDEYLKTPATCTEAAVYCKSCKCGLASETDTFSSGDALVHEFPETWEQADEKQHKHVCERCDTAEYADHAWDERKVVNPATITSDGSYYNVQTCKGCGYELKSESVTIPKIYAVTLSSAQYTYNGKVKTPSVTVKDAQGTVLVKNTDYTVSYSSGRKNVGAYSVKIAFKGNYAGTKTLTFKINPKKATIKKPSRSKTYVTVKWARQSSKMSTKRITGYQVQIAKNKSFTSGVKSYKVKGYKKTSKKIKKLKRKTTYYVRVRTYMGSYYSGWSTVKAVKTK